MTNYTVRKSTNAATSKTMFAPLAALAVGIAVVACVPASADVSSTHSGQLPRASATSDAPAGGSSDAPRASAFVGFYGSGNAAASCAPNTVHHQRTDFIEYPMGCN